MYISDKQSSTSRKKFSFFRVIHFSDGAARQYKHFKNLVNPCDYEKDHHLPAEWYFLPPAMTSFLVMADVALQNDGIESKLTGRERKANSNTFGNVQLGKSEYFQNQIHLRQ